MSLVVCLYLNSRSHSPSAYLFRHIPLFRWLPLQKLDYNLLLATPFTRVLRNPIARDSQHVAPMKPSTYDFSHSNLIVCLWLIWALFPNSIPETGFEINSRLHHLSESCVIQYPGVFNLYLQWKLSCMISGAQSWLPVSRWNKTSSNYPENTIEGFDVPKSQHSILGWLQGKQIWHILHLPCLPNSDTPRHYRGKFEWTVLEGYPHLRLFPLLSLLLRDAKKCRICPSTEAGLRALRFQLWTFHTRLTCPENLKRKNKAFSSMADTRCSVSYKCNAVVSCLQWSL